LLADKPDVERRKEPRLKVRQPVTLMVLGAKGSHLIEACVLDMSGGGLKLRAPAPVPCGTQVKIDGKNMLILGEVAAASPKARPIPWPSSFPTRVHL